MRSLYTTRMSSPCSLQLEKARAQQRRPTAAINKQYKAGFSNQQSLALFEDLVRLIGEKVCH